MAGLRDTPIPTPTLRMDLPSINLSGDAFTDMARACAVPVS